MDGFEIDFGLEDSRRRLSGRSTASGLPPRRGGWLRHSNWFTWWAGHPMPPSSNRPGGAASPCYWMRWWGRGH